MKINSYHTWKSKTELWRFQIYHPAITISRKELYVSIPTNFRILTGNGYFGFGFSIFGFGVGFDFSRLSAEDAKNIKQSENK